MPPPPTQPSSSPVTGPIWTAAASFLLASLPSPSDLCSSSRMLLLV
uniref:Uncharacterized protein n=1 Tax=Anguilla anguilla TaxID=7936 RepID=A0A0E9T2C8_ANGAN